MTPTPEDIALAYTSAKAELYVTTTEAAQLIAAHTAKLRARIKELEQELATVKRDREYIASGWAGQLKTAHKVIAESATNPGRVPVLVGGDVVADSFGNILFREQPHPMVELAEIGRLAVEHQRTFRTLDFVAYVATLTACASACETYLAKQKENA